jgi:hypothetical protein
MVPIASPDSFGGNCYLDCALDARKKSRRARVSRFIRDYFFVQLPATSPLLRRAQDTNFAANSTRGISVNYFAHRARHCVKVP